MARAGYYGQVQDAAGNIVPSPTITVRRLVSGSPLVQLYEQREGGGLLDNPFTAETDGSFEFYVGSGGAFRIVAEAVVGGEVFTRTIPYVAISTGAEADTSGAQEPGYSYSFNDQVFVAPPASGEMIANNVDLSAVTEIYVSATDSGGSDIRDRLLELDPGTKEVKSAFTLKTLIGGSVASWLVDDAVLVGSTHVKLTVSEHNGVTAMAGSVFFFREVAGGNGIPVSYLDTDGTLAANSDAKVATQKAVKTYVDNVAAGLDIKPSVLVATTANITLSGTQTIDGVAVTAGKRVLVKSQSAPAENGIYVCAAGAWARATDMDAWAEIPGAHVWVEQGTANANTAWTCISDEGGTLNTTAITWTQFGGTGAFQELNALLSAISALGSNGIIARTSSSTVSPRTITAGASVIVTDGDGVAGNPTIVVDLGTSGAKVPLLSTANTHAEIISAEKGFEVPEIAAPSSPATNRLRIYAKDVTGTTKLFTKDSAGTETELGSGGGGADLTPVWRALAKVMMKIADIQNLPINWIGQISDSFDVTTGLNTGGSTNMETAEAGVVKPSIAGGTSYANTGGTGNRSAQAGWAISTNITWSTTFGTRLINGNQAVGTAEIYPNPDSQTLTAGTSYLFLLDLGTTMGAKIIDEIKIYMQTGGSTAGTWKIQGSSNGSSWTDVSSTFGLNQNTASQVVTCDLINDTAYRYYQMINVSGTIRWYGINELEFKIGDPGTTNNMTAISAAFDLPVEPNTVDIFFIMEEVDAMTPTTDYTAGVSIDGGSNYDNGTIDEIGTVGGLTICQVIGIDVSARTGTSLRWRVQTLNGDRCKLHEIMVRGY